MNEYLKYGLMFLCVLYIVLLPKICNWLEKNGF
jgi:hypothetical protein